MRPSGSNLAYFIHHNIKGSKTWKFEGDDQERLAINKFTASPPLIIDTEITTHSFPIINTHEKSILCIEI